MKQTKHIQNFVLCCTFVGQLQKNSTRNSAIADKPRDAFENTPLPMCYHVELDRCWSNGTSVHMKIERRNWTRCFPPFKSTRRIDTDRSGTCDFFLTFRNNHGPALYRFQDTARYWPNSVIFIWTQVYLTPPLWDSLGIVLRRFRVVKNLEWLEYQTERKVWWYIYPFGYNARMCETNRHTDRSYPPTKVPDNSSKKLLPVVDFGRSWTTVFLAKLWWDRQTDRQTCTGRRLVPRLRIASQGTTWRTWSLKR